MKKAEAISILATSVRPREAKDRARYDKAVKMAIEALSSSEIPNSSDTIYRQAAIDVLNKLARENFTLIDAFSFYLGALHDAADEIKNLPSAQPEIVRCKDCKHWDGVDTCDVIDAPVWDDDFCSMAERRSDEQAISE